MDTTPQLDRVTSRRSGAGRLGLLWGALGMLALIVVSRFVTSDLVAFSSVTQRSCGNGFCVERVHAPDLVFVSGSRKVEVGHDGPGPHGRVYVQQDPFDDHSDVKIVWNADGGVSLSDETATLTWRGDTLAQLDQ